MLTVYRAQKGKSHILRVIVSYQCRRNVNKRAEIAEMGIIQMRGEYGSVEDVRNATNILKLSRSAPRHINRYVESVKLDIIGTVLSVCHVVIAQIIRLELRLIDTNKNA